MEGFIEDLGNIEGILETVALADQARNFNIIPRGRLVKPQLRSASPKNANEAIKRALDEKQQKGFSAVTPPKLSRSLLNRGGIVNNQVGFGARKQPFANFCLGNWLSTVLLARLPAVEGRTVGVPQNSPSIAAPVLPSLPDQMPEPEPVAVP